MMVYGYNMVTIIVSWYRTIDCTTIFFFLP